MVNFKHDEISQLLKPLPLRNNIRNYFVHNGYIELLTPNIIDPSSAELTHNKFIRIENPLGEEMSVMRPSMIPAVLKAVSFNIRQGNQNLKLFETGKVFYPQNNITNSFIEGIDEREQLVIALTGNSHPRQWSIPDRKFDFFDIKGSITELLNHIRLPKYKLKPISKENLNIFDSNSAEIFASKISIGIVGSINKNVLKKYDIDPQVFIAIIDLTTINDINIPVPHFTPMSLYPIVKRDLAFIVNETINAKDIKKTIQSYASSTSSLLKSVNVFDVYTGKNIEQGKHSIGFELTFSSNDRTLTDNEVENEIKQVIKAIEKKFNAKLRN